MMRASRVLAAVSAVGMLRCSPCRWHRMPAEPHYTTAELRKMLREQRRNSSLPPSEAMATASRLAMALAESREMEERLEGLKYAEELWQALAQKDCPLPAISQLTMKMLLSSAMHRCALACERQELVACWASRLAERKTAFTVDNFLHASEEEDAMGRSSSIGADGEEEETVVKPDPRIGLTAEDIAEDAKEAREKRRAAAAASRRPITPLQRLKRDMMLEHPVVQIHERSPMSFGPRYTG